MGSKRPIITREEARKFADKTTISIKKTVEIGTDDVTSEESKMVFYKDTPAVLTPNALSNYNLLMLMNLNANLSWDGLHKFMMNKYFNEANPIYGACETNEVSILKQFEYTTRKKNGDVRHHKMEASWSLKIKQPVEEYRFFQSISHSIITDDRDEIDYYQINQRRNNTDTVPTFVYTINGTKSGAGIPFSYEFPEGMRQPDVFNFNEVFVKMPPDGDTGNEKVWRYVLDHSKKDAINIVRPTQYSFTAMQQFTLQQFLEKYNTDKVIIIM